MVVWCSAVRTAVKCGVVWCYAVRCMAGWHACGSWVAGVVVEVEAGRCIAVQCCVIGRHILRPLAWLCDRPAYPASVGMVV